MTEQVQPGEIPEKPEAAPEPQPGKSQAELLAELESARKALKDANREAAERRKKLEAFEAAEAKRKEDEMSEAQKLQKALEETASKLKAMETNELRRKVAAKYNLPEALALRLQGGSEEEMDADAKALAEILPKPQPKQPGPQPANPGVNGGQPETVEQKRARLFGQRADIFSDSFTKEHGGGIFFTSDGG